MRTVTGSLVSALKNRVRSRSFLSDLFGKYHALNKEAAKEPEEVAPAEEVVDVQPETDAAP